MSLEEFLIPGLRQKAPQRGGMWAVSRTHMEDVDLHVWTLTFPAWAGRRGECSSCRATASPLWCNWMCCGMSCGDPSELEAVHGGVGQLFLPKHFCQSTNGCCSLQAADSNQCVCVSLGPADFFVKGGHHCFFKTTERFHKQHLKAVTIFSSWRAEDVLC